VASYSGYSKSSSYFKKKKEDEEKANQAAKVGGNQKAGGKTAGQFGKISTEVEFDASQFGGDADPVANGFNTDPDTPGNLGPKSHADKETDQIASLTAQRDEMQRQRAARISQAEAEAAAIRQQEDAELAKLDEKPKMRDRLLRGLVAALAAYGSNDPGATAARIIQEQQQQRQMMEERKQQIYDRRASRNAAQMNRAQDEYFQSTENTYEQQAEQAEAERKAYLDSVADERNYKRQLDRDETLHGYDMTEIGARTEAEKELAGIGHKNRLGELAQAHTYRGLETVQEAQLRRENDFVSEMVREENVPLGLAQRYAATARKPDSAWTIEDHKTADEVRRYQQAAAQTRQEQARQQQLNAMKGFDNVPVKNADGSYAMARDGRAITMPLTADDAASGRTPNFVRGEDGRVRVETPTVTPQQSAPQGVEQAAPAEGGDLIANLGELVNEHGVDAVLEDVKLDPGLSPEEKAAAVQYLTSIRSLPAYR
jgi:hypothetical protein